MIACSLANSTDPDKAGVRYLEREREYKQCAERLGGVDKPAQCMAVIVEALERNPEQDFLGELFMELELGNIGKDNFSHLIAYARQCQILLRAMWTSR